LYLPAVCSGFAQSSLHPPLLASQAGSSGSSFLSGAPIASSLLWGHPLLRVSIHTRSCGLAPQRPGTANVVMYITGSRWGSLSIEGVVGSCCTQKVFCLHA
ncbi:unnamed protein product, partial [Staurois parvus]